MAELKTNFGDYNLFTYIWTIENACENFSISSPEFAVKARNTTERRFKMIWKTKDNTDILSLQHPDIIYIPAGIDVKCEFSFLGTNGLPLLKGIKETNLRKKEDLCSFVFCEENSVFIQKREEILPNDTLTVRCRIRIIGKEIKNPDLCYGHTILRMEKGSFVWKVREFSSLPPGDEKMIILNPTAKTEFQCRLCFLIKEVGDEQYLCLYKMPDYVKDYNVTVHLLDATGQSVFSSTNITVVGTGKFMQKRTLIENQSSFLPKDVLSLRFEFQLILKVWNRIEYHRSSKFDETESEINMNFAKQNETSTFKEAMKGLLLKGSLSDVNLEAGSMSFPAHKCILSARSPFFEALFNGDMKEKTDDCFKIQNIDADTMRRLLSYIYTDSVGDLQWQNAMKLYRAADEYELLDLKSLCSTFLKSNISVSNFSSILYLGDMHHNKDLLEKAQDFIMKQGAQFFSSETWRSFKMDHPRVALETMEQIVLNLKGSC